MCPTGDEWVSRLVVIRSAISRELLLMGRSQLIEAPGRFCVPYHADHTTQGAARRLDFIL